MKLKILACATLLVAGGGTAFADDVKYDKSVAEAAAKKAAEKLGDIRPSIDYDQQPAITQPQVKVEEDVTETDTLAPESQRITKVYEHPEKLDRLSQSGQNKLDFIATGSIKPNGPQMVTKVVWETFDADGNPIR